MTNPTPNQNSAPPSPPTPTPTPTPPGAAQQRITALEQQLAERDQTITSLERRHTLDGLLRDAEAVDLDAARLLTEAAVASMDTPDLALAVQDLRREKPFLFRQSPRTASASGALSPQTAGGDSELLEQAAADAAATGDREDLLRYMRLKRRARS